MERHFVIFYSPGTLVSEQTALEIQAWDVDEAMKMAKSIKERHSARPYGFVFSTRSRGSKDLDSKESKRSHFYYLGGTIKTLVEVKAENNPDNRILIRNMEGNGYDKVIVNTNSWRITLPLNKDDVVLDIPSDFFEEK